MRVDEAKILEIWEIYDPAKLVISPDENLLFVLRNSSKRSSRSGAFWSDLVDISMDKARVIVGGGPTCCMEEDYERLRVNDDKIGKIATSVGVFAH